MSKILIGNKCDLEEKRAVSQEDATRLAQEYGMEYLETSAAEEVNIDNAFRKMAKMILEKMFTDSSKESGEVGIRKLLEERKKNNERKGCCKGN